MVFEYEQGWQLHPIQGNTGAAFMAVRDEEKLFLKKNTSPFLAILSMERITPRLVWTRRTETGDVLTAQEWCNGRCLEREEMSQDRVAQLLSKIHHSDTLLKMLKKVGGKTIYPQHLLMDYKLNQARELIGHPLLDEVYTTLTHHLPEVRQENLRVCHGDVSHKNFLLSDTQHLYLVDWDAAMIADPALDLGSLLTQYVDIEEWPSWIEAYGENLTSDLKERIKWYTLMMKLLVINAACKKQYFHEMNAEIEDLHQWYKKLPSR